MNIYLTDSETSLTIHNGKLVVLKDGERFEFPVRTVDEVCITGSAEISSREICKLAENGIDVTFSHGIDIVCQTNSGNFEYRKDGSIRLSGDIRSKVIETFDEYCEKPVRTSSGFANTIEGRMEEQLCSYIKAMDENNAGLFEPYMKGCA